MHFHVALNSVRDNALTVDRVGSSLINWGLYQTPQRAFTAPAGAVH